MTAFSIPDQIGVPKMLDLCDVCLTALKEWVKPA
jgi:hypothetical protein